MDITVLIALLGALGVGGAVGQLVRWILGGKKESQSSDASKLTGSAADLAEAYERYTRTLNQRLEVLERENAQLRTDVRGMEQKMDRLLRVVDAEKSWAQKALDELNASRGVQYPAPPVLVLGV